VSRKLLATVTLAASLPAAAVLSRAEEPAHLKLTVMVGKSLVIDSPVNIQRVSMASGEIAEAMAVSPRELLINAKLPGETSLILWQQGGKRVAYDLAVRPNPARIDAIRRQITDELPDEDVKLAVEGESVFLRGSVKDLVSAERAATIAATVGKVVNLLRVAVPPVEAQILLKVRFANVDRNASRELGVNLLSTGLGNTIGAASTGQFTPPKIKTDSNDITVSDALNIFLFRRDLNLGATIKALQAKSLLEMLAEPNVLAINGKPASFVSGGEFPFPTLQGGGSGLGAVTIAFREFGVRINFLPTVTPRGTIRLHVTPEVSSLDFAHGLTFQGFNIPALATRRVQTEVELESGQSFAIAGLLDNRTTESLNKIPGLSNIPLFGKLFQSQSLAKSNSELLILITPELVRPIPAGQALPDLQRPLPFLEGAPAKAPQTPGLDVTGPVPIQPILKTVPVENLLKKPDEPAPATGMPQIQFVPVPIQQPQAASQAAVQGGGAAAK
jgi:pilus assembly protein CpaC